MYGHPDYVAEHAAALKPPAKVPAPEKATPAEENPDGWIDAALMAAYEDRGDID